MSSTYYLLCLGHNPATVVMELSDPMQLPSYQELVDNHPECDFVITRVSGAPVEFGCPGFGDYPCGGHPGTVRWVDIDWLHVLWIAIDSRLMDVQRLTRKRQALKCWNFDRLNKLRYELGIERENS